MTFDVGSRIEIIDIKGCHCAGLNDIVPGRPYHYIETDVTLLIGQFGIIKEIYPSDDGIKDNDRFLIRIQKGSCCSVMLRRNQIRLR